MLTANKLKNIGFEKENVRNWRQVTFGKHGHPKIANGTREIVATVLELSLHSKLMDRF